MLDREGKVLGNEDLMRLVVYDVNWQLKQRRWVEVLDDVVVSILRKR